LFCLNTCTKRSGIVHPSIQRTFDSSPSGVPKDALQSTHTVFTKHTHAGMTCCRARQNARRINIQRQQNNEHKHSEPRPSAVRGMSYSAPWDILRQASQITGIVPVSLAHWQVLLLLPINFGVTLDMPTICCCSSQLVSANEG
jgi:hypothetical protein